MLDLRRGLAPLVCGAFLVGAGCGGTEAKHAPPPPSSPPATYAISGAVSGQAADGVTVSLTGAASASTVTDSTGHFTFAGLGNGTYTVTPSRAGFAFSPASTSVAVNGADVGAGEFRASAVARTFTVSGRIDGPGMAGVALALEGPVSGSTTSGDDGKFAFTGLAAGDYRITPRRDGFRFSPDTRSITVADGDASGQDFTSSAEPSAPTWRTVASGTSRMLSSVRGSAPDHVWAVGESGTILSWNGSAWAGATSGTTSWLWGVWASSAADAWAVGEAGTILHWDGSAWSPSSSGVTGPLRGVWGSGPNDVWAVGSGMILHWDGAAWTASAAPGGADVMGVWGTSASDVWAVGGALLHWDGAAWTRVPSSDPYLRHAAWGSSARAVWAVGEWTIDLWNGSAWTVSRQDPHADDQGVWGSAADDVWVVGSTPHTLLHWDGQGWSDATNPTSGAQDFALRSVWGSSASDVWAVGDGGTILRYSP